jgi:NAD(P)-dependent dehydrogenase (short-subunit alcohol dehydrogenase family)
VLKRFGRIDVLVNNAGITQPVKTLEITGADYDRILDVSLRGTLYMSQAVLPCDARAAVRLDRLHLLGVGAARRRHLRRSALLGGQSRRAGPGTCDGARVRRRGHPHQLHHPGPDRNRHHRGQAPTRKRRRSTRHIPLARLGRADDVAGACVFLASDLSAYCTGITLDVNGGMLIH